MCDKLGPVLITSMLSVSTVWTRYQTVVSRNEKRTAAKRLLNESSFTPMAHLP